MPISRVWTVLWNNVNITWFIIYIIKQIYIILNIFTKALKLNSVDEFWFSRKVKIQFKMMLCSENTTFFNSKYIWKKEKISLLEIKMVINENQFFSRIIPKLCQVLKFIKIVGLSDPYVKFKIGGRQIHKSKTVYKSLNPTWDETFTYLLDDPFEPIQIKVWTYSILKQQSIILKKYSFKL